MNRPDSILFKSLVKPFYRENAGTFFFFATVMIFSVGPLNGASLVEYHYSLMMGMLQSPQFLGLVAIGWLLYARKIAAFVHRTLASPQFAILQLLNALPSTKRFSSMVRVQLWLFSPVIAYGMLLMAVAFYHHYYGSLVFVLSFLLSSVLAPPAYFKKVLRYPGRALIAFRAIPFPTFFGTAYSMVLLRFIMGRQRFLVAGIKLFTCVVLFGMLSNGTVDDYDLSFPFLFFNFGIIANGIVIYRVRVFEEKELMFWRTMPLSLLSRWIQYALVYAILLLPELITMMTLAPVHLHAADACRFIFCAFGLLMLMNSVAFLDDFTMKGYLRVMLVILCVEYFFLIADALALMSVFLFLISVIIFFAGYYSFEKARGQIGE